MGYLKRIADQWLIEWKQSVNRKPLIVKGARQIGKTATIRRFAESNYQQVIYINFVEEPHYRMILQDGYSVEHILRNLSLLNPTLTFPTGKTIFLFDEIQDFPDIATTLKFFCIDGRFDVICSGSLLGISYRTIESNSVGYKQDYQMQPMTFEEFLWAKGYDANVADNIYKHLLLKTPFSKLEQQVYMSAFREYCVTGGMPAIVDSFIQQNNFSGILEKQRQLLLDYQEDVRKYAVGVEQTRILNVLRHIPVQLGKDNTKFQISKVAANAKAKDYWGCIEWLEDAGIVNICYALSFPELPLAGNYDETKYKLYFFDSGLLLASMDDEIQLDLRTDLHLGTFKGGLFENIVAQELIKASAQLYYYKRQDSTLEEDFFLRTRRDLVPIEVKARNNTSKSLRTLITSEKYPDITWGIKLINGNIGWADNTLTLPMYCAFLLPKLLKEIE